MAKSDNTGIFLAVGLLALVLLIVITIKLVLG
jgi:hypothetical protein